nr:MAG TPA: hypothetical protein [Caudoviricetes sp.]
MSIKVNELLEIGRRYNEVTELIKALEQEKDELKAAIIAAIGRDNSRTVDKSLTFKVNHVEFMRFDDTAFKAADPETYEAYKTKLVVQDRVSVKEVKGVR